jgi:hypothetical protein
MEPADRSAGGSAEYPRGVEPVPRNLGASRGWRRWPALSSRDSPQLQGLARWRASSAPLTVSSCRHIGGVCRHKDGVARAADRVHQTLEPTARRGDHHRGAASRAELRPSSRPRRALCPGCGARLPSAAILLLQPAVRESYTHDLGGLRGVRCVRCIGRYSARAGASGNRAGSV